LHKNLLPRAESATAPAREQVRGDALRKSEPNGSDGPLLPIETSVEVERRLAPTPHNGQGSELLLPRRPFRRGQESSRSRPAQA
jgi:hypothetical protein